jgi:hypothetical protein
MTKKEDDYILNCDQCKYKNECPVDVSTGKDEQILRYACQFYIFKREPDQLEGALRAVCEAFCNDKTIKNNRIMRERIKE